MKILFVAPLPPPVTGHSLATRVFFDELIKFHQVDVINLSKESFEQGVNSFERILQVVMILKEVWRKRKDADVIYLTISESLAGNIKDLFIYLICYKSLHRMIIHLHGGSIKKLLFDKSKFLFRINKYFIRRMGGIIILGQSHINIFSNIIEKKKMHIVPNFAEDYIFISEEKLKKKFENMAPLRILFLSNLIQGKGYNELVDAFQSLKDDFKKMVKVDFAGGFESDLQKMEFLKKVDANKGIQYHGTVGGVDKQKLLSRAHIFCLPTSLSEGQPISILEAYAAGCAVITTDQGGIRDIFKDKINGYEVQKKSANSIRLVIEQIIENRGNLFCIAIFNRKIAHDKYRTSNYNASLLRIIEGIGSSSNDRQ